MRSKLEQIFESLIWKSRLILIIAVIFNIIGAIFFVLQGSWDILHMLAVITGITDANDHVSHEYFTMVFVGALDNYLIALVLLVFGFGIYEIFISNIENFSDKHPAAKVLEVHSLGDLKEKLAKVIVMVLIVSLFKKSIEFKYEEPIEILILAGSIFLVSLSLYFIGKSDKKH